MKLYALGDLHLGHRANREALADWRARPDDWLILAGDVAESMVLIELGLRAAVERFAKVFWVPGNHELWSHGGAGLRGVAKYEAVVDVCRRLGVVTPEDPYVIWPETPRCAIAPLFLLYDYSFGPDSVQPEGAAAWAAETGIRCADEHFLASEPYIRRGPTGAARAATARSMRGSTRRRRGTPSCS